MYKAFTNLDIFQAWVNETKAPNLLESKTEVVECMIEQLDEMQSNIHKCDSQSLKVYKCKN